ncbi:hypothetical protein BESB_056650 [Besnoitia besnoiti]|uniref:Uncharacterized protein n=1 Tax=Besnoitia besnoiti TaxID=94643 RepID=A0A2A9MFQ9_BESBE|nr:hypothetical protein BESB_056650 [Besnoitia besnoiti]PFH36014.1 hypothetical protein BESB_056650 [Besnoitia besnoiti]
MADYRPCLHQAVNLHMGRLVSSYSSLLDCCSVNEEGNLAGMSVDNFLLKLQVFAIIHSTRSLLTLAADCAVNSTLHDTPRLYSLLTESKKNLRERISQLKASSSDASNLAGWAHQGRERGVSQRKSETDRGDEGDTSGVSGVQAENSDQQLQCIEQEEEKPPRYSAFDDLLGSFFHHQGQLGH